MDLRKMIIYDLNETHASNQCNMLSLVSTSHSLCAVVYALSTHTIFILFCFVVNPPLLTAHTFFQRSVFFSLIIIIKPGSGILYYITVSPTRSNKPRNLYGTVTVYKVMTHFIHSLYTYII